MRLSKLPFGSTLRVPQDFKNRKTSKLIEEGPFVSFPNPGLGYYSPIGALVLDNVTEKLHECYRSVGMQKIKFPSYMRRETLQQGEEVSSTFAENFVTLPPPMEGYVGLTTHEMDILNWLSGEKLSERSLPLMLYSPKDILRIAASKKGILKLREFGVFAGLSLEGSRNSLDEGIANFGDAVDKMLKGLNIHYVKSNKIGTKRKSSNKDFDLEHFYCCPEGENLIVGPERRKALSLSIAYHYAPISNPTRVVSSGESLMEPYVGSFSTGIERLLYATFDSNRDSRGFNLPPGVRPFDVSVLSFNKNGETAPMAEQIYEHLKNEGVSVLFEDRHKKRQSHANFSDYFGVPTKIIVTKKGVRIVDRESKGSTEKYHSISEAIGLVSNKELKNRF